MWKEPRKDNRGGRTLIQYFLSTCCVPGTAPGCRAHCKQPNGWRAPWPSQGSHSRGYADTGSGGPPLPSPQCPRHLCPHRSLGGDVSNENEGAPGWLSLFPGSQDRGHVGLPAQLRSVPLLSLKQTKLRRSFESPRQLPAAPRVFSTRPRDGMGAVQETH